MTALLLDTETVRDLLQRVDRLSGTALREAFVCSAIESGGTFHVPAVGRAVIDLHRITAQAETEAAVISAWIARARAAL